MHSFKSYGLATHQTEMPAINKRIYVEKRLKREWRKMGGLYHVFLIEVTVRGAVPQGNHQIIPRIK
jgi:hypothetical protein